MRTIETNVSLDNIKAQIELLLRNVGLIKDQEDLVSMNFNTKLLKSVDPNVIPITVKTRESIIPQEGVEGGVN